MQVRKFVWPVVAAVCITGGSYLASLTAPWTTRHVLGEATIVQTSAETAKPTPKVEPGAVSGVQALSNAFRTVHNAIKDAVVNIDTTRKVTARPHSRIPDELRKLLPPGMGEELPDEGPDATPGPGTPRSRPLGTGSGVIVSADGYILTNNHVVEGADEILVKMDEGRELKAKVVGRDPKSDLAVIKIDADHLTYAKLGDSDSLQVGDWVLAFGSPFGFDQTMTQGIISAKGRQVPIIGMHNPALQGLTYENFLQTDAAINPGNSGGPLVNLQGEVIGINTAIASNSGAYNGIGFSIPSNDAKYIMDQLIKNGKVVRGYMGVGIADVHDPRIRPQVKALGYTGSAGVLISEVRPDSPGGKGGLKVGDIVTAINGNKINTLSDLRNTVARTAPGTEIKLSVFRNGKNLEVQFPVGQQPETAFPVAQGPASEKQPATPDYNALGITVTEKNGQVVVTNVDPRGLGAEQGLDKGDVIMNLQGKDIKSTADFDAALKGWKPADGMRMSVRKADGTERFMYFEKQ